MSRWLPSRSTRRLAGQHPASPFTRRLRFRPVLLELEGRVMPATLTVTNLSDHNAGSLRAELGLAQNGDTIVFANGLSGTIILTSGKLELHSSIAVQGPGAAQIRVSGNNASQVFWLFGGSSASISGLAIVSGRATSAWGGGVRVDIGGMLTLRVCSINRVFVI